MNFTTRPEIKGTFGVVTSTHWLASSAGMRMLELGGNAFDAATAAGFVLQVVEPHLNGPGGDMTLQFFNVHHTKARVLCGQGCAPEHATIEHFKKIGIDLIPNNGLLATVVPGAFGAWLQLCHDYGNLRLRDVLEPAIDYAENGFPLLERTAHTIKQHAQFFKTHWPTSYQQWLPNGKPPKAGDLFKLPRLAKTFNELLEYAESAKGRDKQFTRAYNAFYGGFIGNRIIDFIEKTEVMDASGQLNKGVLSMDDLGNWHPLEENPVKKVFHGWTIQKAGPWSQGPVLLQCLALLDETDFSKFKYDSSDFVHVVVEAMKLAYADREVYYGDPAHVKVPIDELLSDKYTQQRRRRLRGVASSHFDPGKIIGFEDQKRNTEALVEQFGIAETSIYEPTMEHLAEERGDTVHLDVIDKWGNMVSATPSGGWLHHSPTIPDLGFCLNTRAQMFSLKPGLANSLEPFKRPRTTLTPTLAFNRDTGQGLAMGTPGGDMQDQWQLILMLRLMHYDLNLQQAIDAPMFHTNHFPSSFYPRKRQPKHVMVEGNFNNIELQRLRAKGHIVEMGPNWSLGRLTAAMRDKNGVISAAATPRGMQAYAVGR